MTRVDREIDEEYGGRLPEQVRRREADGPAFVARSEGEALALADAAQNDLGRLSRRGGERLLVDPPPGGVARERFGRGALDAAT